MVGTISRIFFPANLVVAFAVVSAACATAPSPPANPPDLEQRVRAIGKELNPDTIKAAFGVYGPLQSQEPYAGVKVTRDQKYGPDERHRLDVFQADVAGGAPRPVLMFVHGGGYVAGDKRRGPFYDNISVWAARHGLLAINMTYRLAPKHPWPAGAEDVGAAVRWTLQHAASYGGDPRRIYLMGHSAGATHVAAYIGEPRFHGPAGVGLAGGILLSGLFDPSTADPAPIIKAYFGEDAKLYGERSAIRGLKQSKLPLMLAQAELDPYDLERQTVQLFQAICERDRQCPRFVWLPMHTHLTEVASINTRDEELSNQILEFSRKGR